MPEAALTPERRRVEQTLPPPEGRAGFVELGMVSCFSFLRGASDAVDLATTARALGYDALGIADANTMAGVVRLHSEAKALGLTPVIGCRIETVEGLEFLAYPADRTAYGRLCRLISAGRMGKLDGQWQDKGLCDISLTMLAGHAEGVHLVLVPPANLAAEFTIAVESNVIPFDARGGAETRRRKKEEQDFPHKDHKDHKEAARAGGALNPFGVAESAAPDAESGCAADAASLCSLRPLCEPAFLTAPLPDLLPHLTAQLPTLGHLAASYLYSGDDLTRIARLDTLAREHGLAIL
ncbi:MAG: PHP domain-containing protein, partial [Novosphingobium sp.]